MIYIIVMVIYGGLLNLSINHNRGIVSGNHTKQKTPIRSSLFINPRYIFLLVIFIFAINFSSAITAEPNIQIFRTNTPIDLKIQCLNNFTYCSVVAQCNITATDTFNNPIINNALMQNQISFHNYTITNLNTSLVGSYTANVICVDNGVWLPDIPFNFLVTPNGDELSISNAIIYIFSLLLAFLLFFILLYGAVKIPFDNYRNNLGEITGINYKKYIKIFCICFCYVIILWICYVAYNITLAYTSLLATSQMFLVIYRILLVLLYPIVSLYVILNVIYYIKDLKMNNLISRGFNFQ